MNLIETEKKKFSDDWWELLSSEFGKEYMQKVYSYIISRKINLAEIYPSSDKIYKAFEVTPYKKVKIVILGQDPYPTAGMAMGLSFSIPPGSRKVPPSLVNIFKEIENDVYNGLYLDKNPDLTHWARQGVFLLNTCLTVEEGEPNSHQNIGWEEFTKKSISLINEKDTPVVFMLWGNNARQYKSLITNPKHLILEAGHPSPFSAEKFFFGNKHFSKANQFLMKNNIEPIGW